MKRLLIATCVLVAAAAPAGRVSAAAATPAPALVQQAPSGPLAYYMMIGNRIINATPYKSPDACTKALAAYKKRLPPSQLTIVCALRNP